MCSPRLFLLVASLALCLVRVAPVAAQVHQPDMVRERVLLARAESLLDWAVKQDSEALNRRRADWRARLSESGGLVIVLPKVVRVDDTRLALDSARSLLREFGGIPEAFLGSLVIFSDQALDTGVVLAAPGLRARLRVQVSLMVKETADNWTIQPWQVASSVMQAYRLSLDKEWRTWLPADYGLGAWERAQALWAYGELTRSPWSVGTRCVAGEPASCRRWLGLDRDSSPYTTRYAVAELRSYFSSGSQEWYTARSDQGVACLQGEDAACVDYARHAQRPPQIPSADDGRRSMVRALQALHGRAAVARALVDSAGSVGERLARAAGISEDSLVREWRYWVLTRGGRPRERSFAADAAPVFFAAGLLLFVATRSRG